MSISLKSMFRATVNLTKKKLPLHKHNICERGMQPLYTVLFLFDKSWFTSLPQWECKDFCVANKPITLMKTSK